MGVRIVVIQSGSRLSMIRDDQMWQIEDRQGVVARLGAGRAGRFPRLDRGEKRKTCLADAMRRTSNRKGNTHLLLPISESKHLEDYSKAARNSIAEGGQKVGIGCAEDQNENGPTLTVYIVRCLDSR